MSSVSIKARSVKCADFEREQAVRDNLAARIARLANLVSLVQDDFADPEIVAIVGADVARKIVAGVEDAWCVCISESPKVQFGSGNW